MIEAGTLNSAIKAGVGELVFAHPKGNSLPGELLRAIATQIDQFGDDKSVRVILLKSEGERTFCAGASFDELLAVSNFDESKEFFGGFSQVILAIRRCAKLVIARVQGKAVGGGVGVISACDYALATEAASIKLSELALGIGPFIIGPAVRRKLGLAGFGTLAIDADWKDAAWAKTHGLYAETYKTIPELDEGVNALTARLASFNPEAMSFLKSVLWEGTDNWEELVPARVDITAKLAITDFVQDTVAGLKKT